MHDDAGSNDSLRQCTHALQNECHTSMGSMNGVHLDFPLEFWHAWVSPLVDPWLSVDIKSVTATGVLQPLGR